MGYFNTSCYCVVWFCKLLCILKFRDYFLLSNAGYKFCSTNFSTHFEDDHYFHLPILISAICEAVEEGSFSSMYPCLAMGEASALVDKVFIYYLGFIKCLIKRNCKV